MHATVYVIKCVGKFDAEPHKAAERVTTQPMDLSENLIEMIVQHYTLLYSIFHFLMLNLNTCLIITESL